MEKEILELLKTIQGDITSMKGNINSMQGDINSMKSDITSMQGDIISMKSDITSMQGDIISMKNDINSTKADIVSMKSDIHSLKDDNKEIKLELNKINKKLDAVFEQTADLTEFKTITSDNIESIKKDIKFVKRKVKDTEEDVFVIQDHLKLIK